DGHLAGTHLALFALDLQLDASFHDVEDLVAVDEALFLVVHPAGRQGVGDELGSVRRVQDLPPSAFFLVDVDVDHVGPPSTAAVPPSPVQNLTTCFRGWLPGGPPFPANGALDGWLAGRENRRLAGAVNAGSFEPIGVFPCRLPSSRCAARIAAAS